jgi:YD repeat-containing protein
MSIPLGRTTSYQYDALGQTVRVTDTAGIVTTYGYDDLGRVKQVTRNYLAGQPQNYLSRYNLITRYEYDAVGNQTVMTDTVGRVTQNVYDDNHRLIQTTGNVWPGQPQNYLNQYNLITAYGYNDLGLQEWMTDTVGRVTQNVYDDNHRLHHRRGHDGEHHRPERESQPVAGQRRPDSHPRAALRQPGD